MRCGLVLLVGAALAPIVLAAQGEPIRDWRAFRSSVELTSITATVLDGEGRLVTDLPLDAFEVYEDGELQRVTHFTRDRVPISLGVLLDISDSMFGRRIADARVAVERFLTGLIEPADEFSILAFNHAPRLVTGWTRGRAEVHEMLEGLRPSGGTAAYDAIVAALPLFEARGNQRAALLLISDGADTASDAAARDVRSALARTDAFAYAIAIDPPDSRAINTRVNPAALREVTDATGGHTEVVHSSGDLVVAIARIAEELNSQYLLGYTSPRGADGRYHSIRVRIRGGGHRVRARSGYVARP